ncbi:hypothetical protein J7443_24465 [Tropicibacter sp. R15_0]|jgi:hypothetical protein|uniref:hypothetical protein n=1 Tax=Tropicibacter sp. R15_0 TaxID=2821101 RepID=UPI001ADB02EF|nr:hypothetical protein [Tropicibacter sp. R15_0]MBO9468400.1 hypothetical protein [Tropicibacter sp. R15_0]
MSSSSHAIALRIALILEEASPEELAEAIDILRRCGNSSDLLQYLAATSKANPQKSQRTARKSTKATKPIDQMTSKSVLELEKTDPNKHQVLAEFDRLVRQGKVLATNDALRKFGERISKEFRPRKALKDNISAVMAMLAPMPQNDMERHIKMALDSSPRREADEYQKLANYLMHGGREIK